MKLLYTLIILSAFFIAGCDKDPVTPEPIICSEVTEIQLWGETYDIATTTELNLSNQGLIGSIPPEIGCLTNLTHLTLSSNQLTGEIPSEIWKMTNLTWLDLGFQNYYNIGLTGEIPPEIGNLTNLTSVDLHGNQLTGSIPTEMGNLMNLYYLSLRYNQLTGEIPPEICDLIDSNNLDMGFILSGNNLINTCD